MEIKIRIERRKIKNLNMYIRPPYAEVLVTAPYCMPEAEIDKFIKEKRPWMEKHLKRLRDKDSGSSGFEKLTPSQKKEYTNRLYDILPELLLMWQKRMGVELTDWRLRVMKACWGVCHCNKKTITFNTYLGGKSADCIEYIAVHELCHLLVPDHSKKFYYYMDKYLPDWRERKKKLNQ